MTPSQLHNEDWASIQNILQRILLENQQLKKDMNTLNQENDIMKESIDKISKRVFPYDGTKRIVKNKKHEQKYSDTDLSTKVDDYGIDIDRIIKEYKKNTNPKSKFKQENNIFENDSIFQSEDERYDEKFPVNDQIHISNFSTDIQSTDSNQSDYSIEIQNSDCPENDDQQFRLYSRKRTSTRFRLSGVNKRSMKSTPTPEREEFFNTETIHMYAVSMAYLCATQPSPWKRTWSWIAAFISFFTIFAQMTITLSLISEASSPTCAMHDECQRGMFCDGFNFYSTSRYPRCLDCVVIDFEDECESAILVEERLQLAENMWFEQDFTPHIDSGKFLSMNASNIDIDLFAKCATAQYCKNNEVADDIANETCPHLGINMAQFGGGKKFVFVLICILFGSNLLSDMKESNIERKVLIDAESKLQEGQSMPFSVFFIHTNLIFRRFMLPVITFGAGISVSLSQQLSAQNIVLNLIAVLFINEADNLLGALLLSPRQHLVGDAIVKSANMTGKYSYELYNTTRSYAIFLSIVMSIVCFKVQYIAKIFGGDVLCDSLKNAILNFGGIVIIQSVIIIRTFRNLAFSKHSNKISRAFLEFFCMYIALYCGFIFIGLEYTFDWTDALVRYPPVPICVGLVSSICAGIRPYYIHENNVERSFRGNMLDIFVGATWVLCQSWSLSRIIESNY